MQQRQKNTWAALMQTYSVASSRYGLPVAPHLLLEAERVVPEVVLLLRQAADEAGQLGVLPQQPLGQSVGGASCQQGNALQTEKLHKHSKEMPVSFQNKIQRGNPISFLCPASLHSRH